MAWWGEYYGIEEKVYGAVTGKDIGGKETAIHLQTRSPRC